MSCKFCEAEAAKLEAILREEDKISEEDIAWLCSIAKCSVHAAEKEGL